MSKLQISETKDGFKYRGRNFFYLADTAWSVFWQAELDEWEEYLDYRKMQGFNAVQISILPLQSSTNCSRLNMLPFNAAANGNYDFYSINHAYFARAEKMVALAREKGLIPALVVLWCNYAPDSRMSRKEPDFIMPPEMVRPYAEYVVSVFSKYDPVYIISGDTDFGSESTIRHYMTVLETIKSLDPEALTTMHLSPDVDLPGEMLSPGLLDFYMYQSGHALDQQSYPYVLAEKFCSLPAVKPILNGEPCYEGHSHAHRYGRFSDFYIRKAMWQSILSGAKAGLTYGAHGVWCWHRKGMSFKGERFAGIPYEWRTALTFKGAWDVSFSKFIFEKYGMFDLKPANLLLNGTNEIRMAASPDRSKVVAYAPYSTDIKINLDLYGCEAVMFNLDDRCVITPEIVHENGIATVKMHGFNSDVLFIAEMI